MIFSSSQSRLILKLIKFSVVILLCYFFRNVLLSYKLDKYYQAKGKVVKACVDNQMMIQRKYPTRRISSKNNSIRYYRYLSYHFVYEGQLINRYKDYYSHTMENDYPREVADSIYVLVIPDNPHFSRIDTTFVYKVMRKRSIQLNSK